MKPPFKKASAFVLILATLAPVVFPLFEAQALISEPGFQVETVASGLTLPTAMAFAQDGRIFIAEKGGSVRVIQNGVLLPTPVITLTDVNTFGDRGLLGIAADPNFITNGYLYLSYTYENTPGANVGGEKTGRIARVTVVGGTADESSKVVLVGTVSGNSTFPSCENFPTTADCIPSDSPSHSVGGLRFGPDGKLYASLGDGAHFDYADIRSQRAQNIDSLAGKFLRLNADGTAPVDNPFYNGDPTANRSKVFALGVRNAFRFNFNPTTGALFAGDVGWSHFEEINHITSGGNYGWPCWEALEKTTHNCNASSPTTSPVYAYPHSASGAGSVTAGAFPANNAYPDQYDSSLFVGDYAQNWLKRVVISGTDTLSSVQNFDDSPNGPVDVSTGPDGMIYYLSIYTGQLNRLTHTSGNRRPVPVMSATPSSGLLPLTVAFSSTGTTDPDGDALTYAWNFGDGTTSTLQNPTHQYITQGSYSAVLTVTDSNGSAATKSVTITAGNQAPQASITSPSSGSLYVVNQIIQLTGAATDLEDGVLTAAHYHWRIILHHNTHIHIMQEFDGVTNPSFIAPDHASNDVYTEVELTVTDTNGLTDVARINMYLNNGSTSGNLVANPSLEITDEISGQPLGWHQGWFGSMNAAFTYPVAGFDGAKAAKVEVTGRTGGDAKWYFDPVSVTPGQDYLFKDTYTATVPTEVMAQVAMPNGTYQYVFLGTLPAAATPTTVSKTVTVPANAQSMTVFHQIATDGVLIVDNYSLTLASAPADTIVPTVSIAAPANATTTGGVVAVDVTAADNVGVAGVSLVIDGVVVGAEDVAAPYSFTWDSSTVGDGVHAIAARARDAANNVATSSSVSVTVSNIPNLITNGDFEVVNGTDPLNWSQGAWGNHTTVFTYPVVGFDGKKAARTEITAYPVGGTGDSKWSFNKVAVTPGVQYTYSDHYRSNTISDIIGQYTLTDGTFHYFGLAKEIQPNTAWQTISATFTPPANATHVTFFHLISAVGYVEIDDAKMYVSGTGTPSETNAPIVEFTNPLQGQTVSGIVPLTASSTDDTAVTYIFYAVDGIPVTGQISAPPYLFNWDSTTVANGVHTLKATTHDPSGNNSTHTISVTVNNTATGNGNLIQNGGMTVLDGVTGDPQHWFRGGWGTNTRTYSSPLDAGNRVLQTVVTPYTSGDSKWYFEDVPVTPGQSYTLSHRYRTYTAGAATQVMIRYTLTGGAFQYVLLATPAASVNQWTNFTQSFIVPANVVSMTAYHSVISANTLDVDDFDLRLTSQVTDTIAPTASVTAPLQNASLSGVVTVSATANDNIGVAGVTLLVDGVVEGVEDATLPYSFAWNTTNTSNGAHTITVRARDAAGNVATSTAVAVTVSNTAGANLIQNPSVEIDGGNGNPTSWFRGGWGTNNRVFTYPTVGVDGVKAVKVDITSYTDGDAKWFFTDVPVTPGSQYEFSEQYKSTAATEVLARYTLVGGATQYQFLGAQPASANWTTATYSVTAPQNAVSITIFHVLHSVGSLEIDDVHFGNPPAVDTVPPTVAITEPVQSATLAGVDVVSISATDAFGVEGVMLFVDGQVVTNENVSEATVAPYAIPWDTATVADGPHVLTARARDAAGNVSTSTPVNIIVQNNVPVSNNLILNPSVEAVGATGDPANWFRGGYGTNTRTFAYPVAGTDGAKAARVDIANYVDGDAKWRFADVHVSPGQTLSFTQSYRSNATTNVSIRYTMLDGTNQYVSLGNPAASAQWATVTYTLTTPLNVSTMTVMNILHSNGWLEVDNSKLSSTQIDAFANGMISYTFDDGWLTHYTEALPILNAANVKGTFYIVSNETMNPPGEHIGNPNLDTVGLNGDPENWFRGGWGTNNRVFTYPVPGVTGSAARIDITSYTDGDAKWYFGDIPAVPNHDYTFKDSYNSTVSSELLVRYTSATGVESYVALATLPSTGGVWQTVSKTITPPADVDTMTVFHLIHGVGSLTVDDYSIKSIQNYVDPAQMLALQSSGHELGGHSRTHPPLTTLSTVDAQTEIQGSRTEIQSMGGLAVNSFAYPYGDYNDSVKALTQGAGYSSGRSVDRGYNTKSTDKYALKIQQVGRTTTLADIQGWTAQAMADKTWLILMFHQIDSDPAATLGVTPAFLQQIVTQVAGTGIEVIKVSDGVARMNP